jgi:hypothetical protein
MALPRLIPLSVAAAIAGEPSTSQFMRKYGRLVATLRRSDRSGASRQEYAYMASLARVLNRPISPEEYAAAQRVGKA